MKLTIKGSWTCPPVDNEQYLKYISDTIVSGDAKGADTYVREFAKKKGLKLIEFFPNYEKYGKVAPIERNKLIVDVCDCVLAFEDEQSHGTQYTIEYARVKAILINSFISKEAIKI